MADFIILSSAEADQVRGLTTPTSALVPVPLKDGSFVLPLDVLADPAFAAKAAVLKALPTRAVALGTPSAVMGGKPTGGEVATDQAVLVKYAYQSAWPPGAIIDGNGAITFPSSSKQ